ncbi:protein stunted isoform X1 [Euwallacea fornicatus]|uniref:protein stunted isoform X1 n=1 Tax=Euwallacea fornicatus TaxID=995702 RepID=UPI00338E9072
MSAWRAAGLNYINYSNIAAKVLRQALKADLRADAAKRNDSHIKVTKWQDGKPIKTTEY